MDNNNNIINNENNNQSYGDYVNSLYNSPQDENKSNITKLIISIVNAVVVAPFILQFAVIWLIFGAFSGNPATYYGILIACLAYFIFTIIFLLKSIWKSIKSQKGKIIFIIVVLLLLGRFALTYNHVRNDIDKRRTNDITQSERIKDRVTEDLAKKEIPTEKFIIDNSKVIDRVLPLGYNKTTDNCSPTSDCYTNGKYFINHMKTIDAISVQRDVKKSNMKEYDCNEDLVLLSTMYNNQDLLSFKDIFNDIIRKADSDVFSNFVIELKGMRIRIYISYDNKISYEISSKETKTIFNPNSLRATILKEKSKENMLLKEQLYSIVIADNMKYFKMNDYIYSHYHTDENNFRKVNIQEGHYSLNVDNSGSTGNYEFDYSNYKDGTELSVEVEGNYFDKSYKSFIENDIAYFNEKLGMRHEYSEYLNNTLKTFIDNKEKNLEIDVDNTLSIKIRRADFATSLRYFTIRYIFK